MYKALIYLLFIITIPTYAVETTQRYLSQLAKWQLTHKNSLVKPGGALTISDLIWLHPGVNSIGSSLDNTFVLDKLHAPPHLGVFIWEGNKLITKFPPHALVTDQRDILVREREVHSDEDSFPDHFFHGPLMWHVIKRNNQFAIRVINKNTKYQTPALDFYMANKEWVFTGNFTKQKRSLMIKTTKGEAKVSAVGSISFDYQYDKITLIAFQKQNQLLIPFYDKTNQTETSEYGRYLSIPWSKKDRQQENITIDFNYARNFDCVYTALDICYLPPPHNTIPFDIFAGEKNYDSEKSK